MAILADSDHCWFALQVKAHHESVTARALHNKGYEEFLPLCNCYRRWTDRVKELRLPLFPGYVFCRFSAGVIAPIVTTPGVIRIVGNGKRPAPVDESEITALQAVAQSGAPCQPWPHLEVGDLVRLGDGPLWGLEGILLASKNHHRLLVSVTLLQRSVAVEIDRQWISLIRSARSRVPGAIGFPVSPAARPLVGEALLQKEAV